MKQILIFVAYTILGLIMGALPFYLLYTVAIPTFRTLQGALS